MKIVCFGDSNTWGYDPRDFFGGPYEEIWPELLQKQTGWNVVNWGENGREIPIKPVSFPDDMDLLILMLGTNDLLHQRTLAEIIGKMEAFLRRLPVERSKILLISPPHLRFGSWVTEPEILRASQTLAESFRILSLENGILFADAQDWNVEIAFDGVHFTEQGHKYFADGICKKIIEELKLCCKLE